MAARKRKKRKKSDMTITISKRKKGKRARVKTVKFSRTLRKARSIAKKTMRKALKGVPSVRASIYKKVDVAVAKNIGASVEEAVIAVVNGVLEKKKAKKSKKAKNEE